MWMLSFLPDSFLIWVINAILLTGVVGLVASFFTKYIPFISQYKLPLQLISIVLLVAGVYFRGGYDTEMDWRKKVSDLEEKVKVSEQQSKEANVKIKTVIVEKTKLIREQQVVYKERIKEVEKKIDAQCKVLPEAVDILNQAAGGISK